MRLSIKQHVETTSQHQPLILASQEISSAACVVRVEPHHSTVLEAALANVHEVGVRILQRFGCLLGRVDVLHLELLGAEVEFTWDAHI